MRVVTLIVQAAFQDCMVDTTGTGEWLAQHAHRLVFDGCEAESAHIEVVSERTVRKADPGCNSDRYDAWHERASAEFTKDENRLLRGGGA